MEHLSRYADLPTGEFTFADGRTVTYRRRRFVPGGETMPTLTEVTMSAGDRLDLVTAAVLGDPEQYWRVCDANDVIWPDALEQIGQRVRVAVPQAQPGTAPAQGTSR